MSIRKRDVHFSDWTKVRHALVCNNVQGITETSSFDEVRAFLINSESGLNPFYYYVCYIKDTKEIYTHGQFYDCSKYDDSDIRSLLQTKVDSTTFQELYDEVEENEFVAAKSLTDLNDRLVSLESGNNDNYASSGDFNTLSGNVDGLYDRMAVVEDEKLDKDGIAEAAKSLRTSLDDSSYTVAQSKGIGYCNSVSDETFWFGYSNPSGSVYSTSNWKFGSSDDSGSVDGSNIYGGYFHGKDFITTSDERLKTFTENVEVDFDALKSIPKKYYYWNDLSMGEDLQIGTSAQKLAEIYPTCVSYDKVSDRYSVNYQKLSVVALAAIDKLYDKIIELESKINHK